MAYTGRDAAKVAGLVVGGAAIGAALGLLYAPQPGIETRRQIKHYAKHYAKRAEVQALRYGRDIKAGLTQAVESGKSWLAKKDMRRLTAV